MKNIFFIVLILSLESNFSISQITFQYGKYVRYDGSPIEVNYGSNSPNHVNYPDFNYRSDWNDYNTSSASLRLFIKYGCSNHKLTKLFVFVEGVRIDKPSIQDAEYTLRDYFVKNFSLSSLPVSDRLNVLLDAGINISQQDWDENHSVGYSTFTWATLVTGLDAEGISDGEPLEIQKSPVLFQKLFFVGQSLYTGAFQQFLSGFFSTQKISLTNHSNKIG